MELKFRKTAISELRILSTIGNGSAVKKINYPGTGNYSSFTYDALDHWVSIVEKNGGTTTSTKQFVWDITEPCEAVNASGTLISQYFDYGQTLGGTSYYYTTDQLGSVREMTDGAGSIHAEYAYNPYGKVTQIQAGLNSDFQFCGYYSHAPSGLNITESRLYSPSLGRWMNRDPVAEEGGVNLFDYVDSDPIDNTDPSGNFAVVTVPWWWFWFFPPKKPCPPPDNWYPSGNPGSGPGDGPGGGPGGGGGGGNPNKGAKKSGKRGSNRPGGGGGGGGGRGRDGKPGDNTRENDTFRDAVKVIERLLGRKLSDTQIQILHQDISKQNFGYQEIIQAGLELFGTP